jgi:PAS domain S-box-containing protein
MDEMLNTAPCGFLEFADDGTILAANSTLLELLGYDPGELEGRRVESILPTAGRIFYQTHLFPLLRLHGRADEVYLSLKSRAGGEVPALVNAARRERDGRSVNDCVLIPIRQRSQYEDDLLRAKRAAEEATRAKDEFLAVVSHELRTPLNAILGWVRLAQTGELGEGMVTRALETIERSARSQSQLIEDILDFARIVSGKLRLDVRRVQPAEVVEAALDVMRPAADAKGIRLQSILDPGAGPVSGDPDRLQQAMWNLLANAVKFTPKGGKVQVRLERINSHVEITVSDTGEGISAEFLPYVFDRFRQADKAAKRQGGLGLGLAITRQIVELHGGTIRAHSAGAGQGAAFTVELPLLVTHHPESRPTVGLEPAHLTGDESGRLSSPPRLDGLQVLVVDDEQDARELLSTVLTRYGASVTAAGTADEALERLPLVRPDVLVSDIEMPGRDGYSLIRAVRTTAPPELRSIPAIALTARARFSDRMSALTAGYQVHVPKPVEPAELITLIANLTHQNPGQEP